jgi:quercetin dioxygenase-like cupin family protein
MAGKTVVRQAGEGTAYWMLGGLYEQKASSDETGGEVVIFEMTLPAGAGPPQHTHPGGESVYVLEGKVRYHIEDEVYEGGPGSFFYIPAGTWENFEPITEMRILVVYSGAGADAFFAEAAEPAQKRELPPPPDSEPDVAALLAVAEKHGMKMRAPVA